MNRVHPNRTERPSLNKECGWKGGDRSGLAQGQELTGRKRRTKHPYRKGKKKKDTTLTGPNGVRIEETEKDGVDRTQFAPAGVAPDRKA